MLHTDIDAALCKLLNGNVHAMQNVLQIYNVLCSCPDMDLTLLSTVKVTSSGRLNGSDSQAEGSAAGLFCDSPLSICMHGSGVTAGIPSKNYAQPH